MIWKESGQMMFRSFCMGKKDNDREISEWYNEVKLGRQIGICGGDIVCWIVKG